MVYLVLYLQIYLKTAAKVWISKKTTKEFCKKVSEKPKKAAK